MNLHKLRLWLAVILFIIALALLVASMLPAARFQQVIPLPPVVLPTVAPLGLIFLARAA